VGDLRGGDVTYDEWELGVPEAIRGDALWKLEVYRLALFLGDLAWSDVTKLVRDRRTKSLADQLYRAVTGISLTVAEGFSRSTGRERARFYEFSLGSARETRDAYFHARQLLGPKVSEHRLGLTTQVIKLLLKMVPEQREQNIKLCQPPASPRSPSRNHVLT